MGYRFHTRRDIRRLPQLQHLPDSDLEAMEVVSAVLPFRVNDYVLEQLIDWSSVPDDPIFRLTFPQRDMLSTEDFERVRSLLRAGAPRAELRRATSEIQARLNPHPAGQMELNVPEVDGRRLGGIQHKYRETVLFFPAAGQTCHAYCTYCFRWPQFVGDLGLRFASRDASSLVDYLRAHPEVSSVLFTGGDPAVMSTSVLRRYLEPLLAADLPHVESIRIGTKAPAWWPARFVSDPDADDLLRLFEEVVGSGRHLAVMGHWSHPRELDTPLAEQAVRRIAGTGAVLRSQAPLIRRVNDDAGVWTALWRRQLRLGVVPYYMFVERDTGPRGCFAVPLARALQIYEDAVRGVSGLGRTVRGPSMSTTAGKVLVDGVTDAFGEPLFVLKFIQARDPAWVGRLFFACFDPEATWLDELRPPAGQPGFSFERALHDAA